MSELPFDMNSPDCMEELSSMEVCEECQAPMGDLKLSIGGLVYMCSRSGCKNHSVGFVDLSSTLIHFISSIDMVVGKAMMKTDNRLRFG